MCSRELFPMPAKVSTQPSTVDEWIEARKIDPERFTFSSNGDLIAAPVESGNIQKTIIPNSKVKAPKEAIDRFFEERSAKIKLAEDDFIAKKHMLHALMIRYRETVHLYNSNSSNASSNSSSNSSSNNENSNSENNSSNNESQNGGDNSNSNSNGNSYSNNNVENSSNSNSESSNNSTNSSGENSNNSASDTIMGFMNQKVAMTLRQKLNDPVQRITKDDIVYANQFVKQAEQALVLSQGKRYVDSIPGPFKSDKLEYRQIHLENFYEDRKIPDPVYVLQHNTFPYNAFWVTQEVNNQIAIENMAAEESSNNDSNNSMTGGGESPEDVRARNARKFSIIRSRMRAKAARMGY